MAQLKCADDIIIMSININFLLLPTRFHIVAASASELSKMLASFGRISVDGDTTV